MALWRSVVVTLWRNIVVALWRNVVVALWRCATIVRWYGGAVASWRNVAMALFKIQDSYALGPGSGSALVLSRFPGLRAPVHACVCNNVEIRLDLLPWKRSELANQERENGEKTERERGGFQLFDGEKKMMDKNETQMLLVLRRLFRV